MAYFSKFEYYSVFGRNGMAVMDSYPRAMNIQKYIHGATLKGFNDFDDAVEWTLYRFEDTYPQKAGAVFGLVLNTPVFFKNLKEKVWG